MVSPKRSPAGFSGPTFHLETFGATNVKDTVAEPSEFQKSVEAMTARLVRLKQTMDQVVETVHQIQDTLTFGDHPELLALDDELDTMYRGQL